MTSMHSLNRTPTNDSYSGIPPNDPGAFAAYTSPTVRFPDGTYLMDSDKIAKRLEDAHPDPSLHLDSPQTAEAAELARGLLFALIANALPTVVEDILQEPSKSWFVKDREGRFGMTIDEFVQNAGGEVAWRKAEPVMKKLKALLQEGKKHEGPFVLGSVPSYSDMVICATFECLERVAKGEFDRVISYDPSFGELHKACKPWTRKDD